MPTVSENASRLSDQQSNAFMTLLRQRFQDHPERHAGLSWEEIEQRLEEQPAKLWSLHQMEITGGQPDVITRDDRGKYLFCDCSAESPRQRRSLSYDRAGQMSRKEHRPANNAVDMAHSMGVDLMAEEQYFRLQELGDFDTKTSSWLKTPPAMRKLGGALFGNFRYGRVFVYHNGAQSYYAARGFRAVLWV